MGERELKICWGSYSGNICVFKRIFYAICVCKKIFRHTLQHPTRGGDLTWVIKPPPPKLVKTPPKLGFPPRFSENKKRNAEPGKSNLGDQTTPSQARQNASQAPFSSQVFPELKKKRRTWERGTWVIRPPPNKPRPNNNNNKYHDL